MVMKMPSFKEAQAIRDAVQAAELKKKQLLAKNKEAARAMLSQLLAPTVSTITEKKNVVNPE